MPPAGRLHYWKSCKQSVSKWTNMNPRWIARSMAQWKLRAFANPNDLIGIGKEEAEPKISLSQFWAIIPSPTKEASWTEALKFILIHPWKGQCQAELATKEWRELEPGERRKERMATARNDTLSQQKGTTIKDQGVASLPNWVVDNARSIDNDLRPSKKISI